MEACPHTTTYNTYLPEQSDDGPNIERLTSERTTMVSPTEQARGWRLTTIGRNQEQDHLTDNGQDQQTLRKMSSTSMSMTQTTGKKHNKHKDHEE